jgi:Cd2+/Zn2+-exporting ATPase
MITVGKAGIPMEKLYLLQGLDCPSCAGKIERGVKKLDGVLFAAVNFVKATLRVEIADSHAANITERIARIVHKYEPGVAVIEKQGSERPDPAGGGGSLCAGGCPQGGAGTHADSRSGHHHQTAEKSEIWALAAGALVFAAALALDRAPGASALGRLAPFVVSYAILGSRVLHRAAKNMLHGQIFDENFLMSIATIGAFLIGDYPEAVAVMLFYQVGELFQGLAVRRSRKSIADLMDIRPDFANLKVGGEIRSVPPEAVRVGDEIIVRPGERIPLDGVVLEGEAMLDTRALTGEAMPRKAAASDAVFSGFINQNGVLTIRVEKIFSESTASRIIDLVENAAQKKAPTENFITTFSRYYTPVVVALAAGLALIPPLFYGDWAGWANRGLIFLVISCPCALVISIPLSFFGGIGGASRKGILVKGGNYLEALGKLDIVVFDKTGTLTRGVFEVEKAHPGPGFTAPQLMELAAGAEAYSSHPIAASIRRAFGGEIDKSRISGYEEIPGRGVRALLDAKPVFAGSAELMRESGIEFDELQADGTKVYVSADGRYAGGIVICDEVKPDARKAIEALRQRGVRKTVMLTGDNEASAQAVSSFLGLDEAHAQLLPDQKVALVERLSAQTRAGGKLAFVGDGINDAPVLARADVGIAMGGLGSDAAIEAADVVLMTDEPSKLAEAIDIARNTKRIVWQNIAFALGVKGLFLLMGAFGVATMWEAVFADVGVALLAVLNAMRAAKIR